MDVFVARQPIFTAQQRVYGYELLFRDGMENAFPGTDPDVASQKVISSSFLAIGLDTLTNGKRAFINFTRDLLVNRHALLLPSGATVIEIVEDVQAEPEVLEACRVLRARGYLLALDDYGFLPGTEALLDLVDFVKVDFGRTTAKDRRRLIGQIGGHNLRLVAEKVETRQDFEEGTALGCSYFQGYFFSRPVVLTGHDITGHRGSYLQLLREAREAEMDFARMEGVIKQDLSLSYKLLRYINTVAFGWRQRIESVRHALVLLGEDSVRRWAILVAVSGMASHKPLELAVASAIRARLCESLGTRLGMGPARGLDLFMMGMFSMIDAVLDLPMDKALAGVPMSEEARDALLGTRGPLHDVLATVIAYERGRWEEFGKRVSALGLAEEEIPGMYQHAVEWAGAVFE